VHAYRLPAHRAPFGGVLHEQHPLRRRGAGPPVGGVRAARGGVAERAVRVVEPEVPVEAHPLREQVRVLQAEVRRAEPAHREADERAPLPRARVPELDGGQHVPDDAGGDQVAPVAGVRPLGVAAAAVAVRDREDDGRGGTGADRGRRRRDDPGRRRPGGVAGDAVQQVHDRQVGGLRHRRVPHDHRAVDADRVADHQAGQVPVARVDRRRPGAVRVRCRPVGAGRAGGAGRDGGGKPGEQVAALDLRHGRHGAVRGLSTR
jgi:hypothetical protein